MLGEPESIRLYTRIEPTEDPIAEIDAPDNNPLTGSAVFERHEMGGGTVMYVRPPYMCHTISMDDYKVLGEPERIRVTEELSAV